MSHPNIQRLNLLDALIPHQISPWRATVIHTSTGSRFHNFFQGCFMACVDSIAKLQQAVSQEDAEVEPLPLFHVFKACSDLYAEILDDIRERKSIEQPTFISLERGHSYLLLWADGYGVTDGSIETSLDKSQRARQATFRLLISISRILTKSKHLEWYGSPTTAKTEKNNGEASYKSRAKYIRRQQI